MTRAAAALPNDDVLSKAHSVTLQLLYSLICYIQVLQHLQDKPAANPQM